MDEYTAYTAATTGDLVAALEGPVDDELLAGAVGILRALLAGGPAEDIGDYAEGPRALRMVLERVRRGPDGRPSRGCSRVTSSRSWTATRTATRVPHWTPDARSALLALAREVLADRRGEAWSRPGWAPTTRSGPTTTSLSTSASTRSRPSLERLRRDRARHLLVRRRCGVRRGPAAGSVLAIAPTSTSHDRAGLGSALEIRASCCDEVPSARRRRGRPGHRAERCPGRRLAAHRAAASTSPVIRPAARCALSHGVPLMQAGGPAEDRACKVADRRAVGRRRTTRSASGSEAACCRDQDPWPCDADPGRYQALSSAPADGTLIDWEAGIAAVLVPWAREQGLEVADEDLLLAYGDHEAAVERETPTALYPEVLGAAFRRTGDDPGRLGQRRVGAAARRLGAGLAAVPGLGGRAGPAPEPLPADRRVQRAPRPGSPAATGGCTGDFAAVITAEDVGAYNAPSTTADRGRSAARS